MAITKAVLDRQATAQVFPMGTTAASGQALLTLNNGTAALTNVVLDAKGSISVAGDLNLVGNLNITGSIDEQNVTNLAVRDINFTLNKGGTTAGAASAGMVIEGDSGTAIAKIIFDSALTSKWKIGDGTSQVEVVTVSGAQTLTNKSIAGSQITGNISGSAGSVTGNVGVVNGGTGAVTLSGLLKGNGTAAISSATAGTDYSAGTAALGTGIVKNTTGTGALSIAVAADFPTLNQNTTGSSASLTTARNIYGNSFNGTSDVTGVIGANYGGTGNGFTAFSGAAATTKTYVLPNANATILTDNTTVTVAQGGTGKTSITAGSIIVGAGTSAPTEVAPGTSGNVLTSNGTTWVSAAPTGSAAYERWTTISGTQDGSNKIFTIGNAVSANSEEVIFNGYTLDSGASNDYILSGTTLTFQAGFTAPISTDKIKVRGTY